MDAPDDAAVYRISDDLALLLTVDFFTPIVDDPYLWGAIAAANAFSDCYAMGGKPVLALNLLGWPQNLDFDLLARVLEGGADKATEAGASVVGGHTVEEKVKSLVVTVEQLLDQLAMPRSIAAMGIQKEEFERALPDLVKVAFDDPSWLSNPRMPLMSELEFLLRTAYNGRESVKAKGAGEQVA